MTYRGHVRNGVVVFDGPAPLLAEGTAVEVVAAEDTAPPEPAGAAEDPTWADVFRDVIGKAEGLPD